MHAQFTGANGAQLGLDIPFEDFLHSGVMRQQALVSMCEDGEGLIRDFVCEEAAAYGDDGEVGQAFGEAAMLASDQAVHNVELDETDVAFVRQRFGRNRGFALVERGIPPLVA